MTLVNITKEVSKAVKRLTLVGTDPNLSSFDNEKTRYLNLLILVSSFGATCFITANFFLGSLSLLLCGVAVFSFNVLLFLLQYYRQPYLARTITYIGYPLLFFAILLFSRGKVSGEYAFFLMILLSVMFFRTRWRQLSMMLYVFILHLASQLINYYPSYTSQELEYILNDAIIFIAISSGLIFITDSFITQIVNTKRKNKRLLKELTISNEELRRLNYMVSHDLRTPLRQIVSFSDLALIANQGGENSAAQDYIKQVSNSAKGLYALTDDLLSLAHLENHQLPAKELSLAAVFAKAKQQFAGQSENVIIETNAQGLYLLGNPTLIGMALQNLVENGLKYNQSARKHIRLTAYSHVNDLRITVEDNGIGIDAKHRESIFEPFQRLDAAQAYQGTGLGLAIVKKIMDIQGGKTWLEPQVSGSKFVLSFPAALSPTVANEAIDKESNTPLFWQTLREQRAIF